MGLSQLPLGHWRTHRYRFACFALCVGGCFVETTGGEQDLGVCLDARVHVMNVQKHVKNDTTCNAGLFSLMSHTHVNVEAIIICTALDR